MRYLQQWRVDTTVENAKILEETYLAMVVGAYARDRARLSRWATT
jgi:hypothetical protein